MKFLPEINDKLNLRVLSRSMYKQLARLSPPTAQLRVSGHGTVNFLEGENFLYYPTVDLLVDEVGPSTTSLRVEVFFPEIFDF